MNEVHKRLDALVEQGAKAWLFDLRANPGGTGSRDMASMFLDGEALWHRTFRDGTEDVVSADRKLRLPETHQLPIAILLDAGSWSATEMFAFSLRAAGRAMIVGERSAGRVGVGAGPLPSGALLGVHKVRTTGPNGEIYNGVGVMPDVMASGDEAEAIALRLLRERIAKPAGAVTGR